MSEERLRAALREIVNAAPVRPDPAAAMTSARRVTGPRQGWLIPTLAATAVILTILALATVYRADTRFPVVGTDSGPSLPDRFPAFSFVQGTTDGRFGRAIALYINGSGHEDFIFAQLILASADDDRYRRLPVPDRGNNYVPRALLSPDGTKVAIGGDGSITVLDLHTGTSTQYPADAAADLTLHAFSADGRRLAYTTPPEHGAGGSLFILDLSNGISARISQRPVKIAAFSPDGGYVAFQEEDIHAYDSLHAEIEICRFDGTSIRSITVPPRTQLAGAQAWSPDGTLLVAVATGPDRQDGPISYTGDRSYVFFDVTGTAQTPAPIPANDLTPRAFGDPVLGWRTPTSMLVSSGDVDGTTSNLIIEVDITNGSHHILSRFSVGARDDLAVGDVQFATALIPEATIRHSTNPNRGSWPTWAIVTAIACLAPAVFGIVLWWTRRIKRRG